MTKQVFRYFFVGKFLLFIAYLVLIFTESPIDFNETKETEMSDDELLHSLNALLVLMLYFISFWGVYQFRWWGRLLFALSYILILPFYFVFPEDTHYSPFSTVLSDYGLLLDGFLIALMYFSEVAPYFEKSKIENRKFSI
jgi:hypothetical protein